MYLPNRELAFVHEDKIVKYLMNLMSERGHPKALFFLGCGFRLEAWEDLVEVLVKHAHEHEVIEVENRPGNGIVYVVEGDIPVPIGGTRLVRVVWMVKLGDDYPSLITAHPISRSKRHGNVR